jgi:hypothetical protein
MRSGDEPSHARSPLRMRLTLATFGLVCWTAGAVAFTLARAAVLAAACAVGACVAVVNVAVVAHRIRSGPHWQPGPLVHPYRPLEPAKPRPRRRQAGPQAPHDVRVRRYLLLMGTAVSILLIDWSWLWRVSMPVAMGASLIAMLMLPIAAVVANAGSFAPRTAPDRTDGAARLPVPRVAGEGLPRAAGAVRTGRRRRRFGRRGLRQIPGG